MPHAPSVTAVIVTHDSADVLPECLTALDVALARTGRRAAVVVVDSGSGDGTTAVAAAHPSQPTVVELGRNGGYAAGINAGLAAVPPTEAALIVNPDVRLAPDAATPLLDVLGTTGPDGAPVGLAGPLLRDGDGHVDPSLRRRPTALRAWGEAVLGGRRAGRHPRLGELVPTEDLPVCGPPVRARTGTPAFDWCSGALLAASTDCLDAVGPWNESFFLYSEETDLCLRALDAGFDLAFVPEAVATHLGGDLATHPDLWATMAANRVRLQRSRVGRARGAAFHAGVVANEALRARRPTSRRALRALLDGHAAVAVPPAAATLGTGSPAPTPAAAIGSASDQAARERLRARPDDTARASHAHAAIGSASDQAARERLRARPDDTARASHAHGVIWFAAQDWWYHNQAHSDFQLAQRIARHQPVLLVNSLTLRMPLPGRSPGAMRRILRKARSTAKVLRRPVPDNPGYHVLSPVVLPLYGNETLRRLNAASVRLQVRVAARIAGITDPGIVVTVPTAWDVVEPMARRSLVFNRSDKQSEFAESDQDLIVALEERLLVEADHVAYVSRSLQAADADLSGDRARFLDHGVDLAHFDPDRFVDADGRPTGLPADLAAVPGPRIGFFGGFDDYIIDFDLLERVAVEFPEASVVLVGDATCPMDRLTRHPNVRWLGMRPYADIPAHGAGFDVALMPWLDNTWIRHCNPIKMKEYLALGLPVVSTDFPEVHRYADVLEIAGGPEDFVARIRKVLDGAVDHTPAQRRAAVADADWDVRAAELVGWMDRDAVPPAADPTASAPTTGGGDR